MLAAFPVTAPFFFREQDKHEDGAGAEQNKRPQAGRPGIDSGAVGECGRYQYRGVLKPRSSDVNNSIKKIRPGSE